MLSLLLLKLEELWFTQDAVAKMGRAPWSRGLGLGVEERDRNHRKTNDSSCSSLVLRLRGPTLQIIMVPTPYLQTLSIPEWTRAHLEENKTAFLKLTSGSRVWRF